MRAAAAMADAFAKLAGNQWLAVQVCPQKCPIPIPGPVQLMGRIVWGFTVKILPSLWVSTGTRFWKATFRCAQRHEKAKPALKRKARGENAATRA